ncbi:MAG: N-acetylmuramoyl-L-alanine amidase, partial [Cyanobacteria bacterium J06641_5]
AVLSPSLRGPQLTGRGSIRQVRLLQRDARTVAISVTVSDGVRTDNFSRLDDGRIVAFDLAPPPRRSFPPLPRLEDPVNAQPASPRPTAPAPVPRSATLVTIDPGHGGKDPGAIGIGGLREKDIVLDISTQVQQILSANGLRVLMTRSDDRFISLQGRVDVSNRANADIFVSIHANAISLSRPDVNGVETFYARGSSRGQALASSIQSSILQQVSIGSRGVKRSGFFVLRHTDMPAALVEVGFVTGREDAPKLRDPSFRRQMAQAIADGILNYVRQSSGAR